jgi:Unconventional myosin tail, actin- and lipid-binding
MVESVSSSSMRGTYVVSSVNVRPVVLDEPKAPPMDYIEFTKNPKLMKLLDMNERLLFADKIKKFRALCFYKQERILAITSCKIYNIKKDKVQRAICFSKLRGVSKATLGTKTEFTLHIKEGHDYRFVSERRAEIIELLKHHYADVMKQNLPIFAVEKETTSPVTVIEKEYKKGVEKFPPEQWRIYDENVLKDTVDKDSIKLAMATLTIKPLTEEEA